MGLSYGVFQYHQIYCLNGEPGNLVGTLMSRWTQRFCLMQLRRQSFREERGFAKGHVTSEIGTLTNYGCQPQLGSRRPIDLFISSLFSHFLEGSSKFTFKFPDSL